MVDELYDAGGGDWVTQVAAHLPMTVIGDIVGIPEGDRPASSSSLRTSSKANLRTLYPTRGRSRPLYGCIRLRNGTDGGKKTQSRRRYLERAVLGERRRRRRQSDTASGRTNWRCSSSFSAWRAVTPHETRSPRECRRSPRIPSKNGGIEPTPLRLERSRGSIALDHPDHLLGSRCEKGRRDRR